MDIPGYAQSTPRQADDGRRVARVSRQRTDGEWTGEAHCETHQRETRPMRRARTHERRVDEEQGTASRETERGKSEGGEETDIGTPGRQRSRTRRRILSPGFGAHWDYRRAWLTGKQGAHNGNKARRDGGVRSEDEDSRCKTATHESCTSMPPTVHEREGLDHGSATFAFARLLCCSSLGRKMSCDDCCSP